MSAWLSEGFRVAINAPWKLVEVGEQVMGLLRWRRGEVACFVSVAAKWELGEEEGDGQTRFDRLLFKTVVVVVG